MNKIALTFLGKDKPGIVASVTKVLFEAGCNIEDSSMTLLRSEFAMILIVELPGKTNKPAFYSQLSGAAKQLKLSMSIRELAKAEAVKEKVKGSPYIISVYGADKPGIVYKVSKTLADIEINITDVQTQISKAAYIMLLEVDVPKKLSPQKIKEKLKKLAASLKVSININESDNPRL